MNKAVHSAQAGSYTANLLGNIRSHLAGLQGYDVMALELIQNADDAKAEEISFDITDQGLLVRNSGQFTYCGDLFGPCPFQEHDNYKCDYHRITDVGSGGKLSRGENIGRFGIGFVSTYQITDHPEIRSSGIKLTLLPEKRQWLVEPFEEPCGTSFFLPWAANPNTEARKALGTSHVSPAHIDQLADDFQAVLRKSLLFLRHVRKAEVRRNGRLLLGCDLDRGNVSDLIVTFRPSADVEHWHILRADAADAAQRLYATHSMLESFQRSTKISIGLRIDPNPLADGLLYAFLPTEQLTGLPLHINADFFPESDRKAVIFGGHGHERAWNEMLIDAVAAELASDPQSLLKMLGDVQLWQLLSRAYDIFSKPSGHPACFKRFWERLKSSASQAAIATAQDGSFQLPNGVFLPRSPLSDVQASAFLALGGRIVSEDLRPFHTAVNQLGAPILTLDRLIALLESSTASIVAGESKVVDDNLECFYQPLWNMINDLMPEISIANVNANPVVKRLLALPFIVTEDLYVVTAEQSCKAPISMEPQRVAARLPRLAVSSRRLGGFPKIQRLVKTLDLESVTSHLASIIASDPVEDVFETEPKSLRDLYSLIAELDQFGPVEKNIYLKLRDLPIWLSSRGFVKASQALLPGDFTDPTGRADLFDVSVLSESAKLFLSQKLGVPTQTIESFVRNVLPSFFGDEGPLDEGTYPQLITELANHPTLVNSDDIRQLLGSLPIVPTQNGGWSRPVNTYRRTDALAKVLGESPRLWLDPSRIPTPRSVRSFIDSLGIRRNPIARHLVDRMLEIAEEFVPTEDARRASSEAFYALCDSFDEWKESRTFQDALADLRDAECFPAEGDSEEWHAAESLYAPYRSEAFRSQAYVLDFRNTARLKTDLLKVLGISINPETELVVNHLLHCIESGTQPHVSTYQVLNERAQNDDPLIRTLVGSRCIYVDSQKLFVRANQVYWVPQQLGRYAFTLSGYYEAFRPLLEAIGVKNSPSPGDLVDIFVDIVGNHFEQSKPVTGQDRSVYDICLTRIASAWELGELLDADLERFSKAPTILSLQGRLNYPDEILLQDSEWHAGFFSGELDQALCKPATELWPFLIGAGVRKLSERSDILLEYVDGSEIDESEIAVRLMDRADIIRRLLHGKSTAVIRDIRSTLSQLRAVSHDVVRIQASVHVGEDLVSAPPVSVQAFYDTGNSLLILARPIGSRSWAHILNALFHQLLPAESGSEISMLTLSLRPLLFMSVEEAHRELSDFGVPFLTPDSAPTEDITSPELGDMSSTDGTLVADDGMASKDEAPDVSGASTDDDGSDMASGTADNPTGRNASARPGSGSHSPAGPSQQGSTSRSRDTRSAETSTPSGRVGQGAKRSRPQHKEQWDRRLLSYVRRRPEDTSESSNEASTSDHNLAVEVVARNAVCAYERERGRIAEQMAQTHPGYDIISRDPTTGEDRYIEVKGVNGEWNQTGVGLSRLQFSNAQNFGNRYWLYVVELVSDPEHIRVHPIQSPATQVTSFMFDGNWRDAVTEEYADPSALFSAGARIHHQDMGTGLIRSVSIRGNTRLLTILFDGKSQETPHVTLNLHRMRILEDDNGNIDS